MAEAVSPSGLLLMAAIASVRLAGPVVLLVMLIWPKVVAPSLLLTVSVEPRLAASVRLVQFWLAMTECAAASVSTVKVREPGVAVPVTLAAMLVSELLAVAAAHEEACVTAAAAVARAAKEVLTSR